MLIDKVQHPFVDISPLILWISLEDIVEQAVIDDPHVWFLKFSDTYSVLLGTEGYIVQIYCQLVFRNCEAWLCLKNVEEVVKAFRFVEV